MSLVSPVGFPVTVEPDSEVVVDFIFDIGEKTLPVETQDALCLPAGVRIAATIKEDPEKLHKQIDNLVEKVLANYPPKTKK